METAQLLFNGIALGSIIALAAVGLTLTCGILRLSNFAHGDFMTLGAYFTYALMGEAFGFNGLLANLQLPIKLPFFLATLSSFVWHGCN